MFCACESFVLYTPAWQKDKKKQPEFRPTMKSLQKGNKWKCQAKVTKYIPEQELDVGAQMNTLYQIWDKRCSRRKKTQKEKKKKMFCILL